MSAIWAQLCSWTVVGIVVTTVFGAGLAVMSLPPPEFFLAKLCFSISAALLLARTGASLFLVNGPSFLERATLSFIAFGLIGLLTVAGLRWVQEREAKASQETQEAKSLADKIFVYERNPFQWDHAGDPNTAVLLNPNTTLRREIQAPPGYAALTPVAGNLSEEVLSGGTDFIVTVHYGQAKIEFIEPFKVWRLMHSFPRGSQTLVASIADSIPPGPIAKGPDEMIKFKLPPGKYKIDYLVQGKTEKHHPFKVESYYWIEIYSAASETPPVSDIPPSGRTGIS